MVNFTELIKEHELLIFKITKSRLRNPFWQEEASQLAYEKMWKVWDRGDEVSEGLASTITANCCKDVCRKHIKENQEVPLPIQPIEDVSSILSSNFNLMMLDLQLWTDQQAEYRQRVIRYVLALLPYRDLKDLGQKVGCGKATVSRALEDLEIFLLWRRG